MTDERTEVRQWLDSIADELRSAEIVPDEECDIAGFLGIEACFVTKNKRRPRAVWRIRLSAGSGFDQDD